MPTIFVLLTLLLNVNILAQTAKPQWSIIDHIRLGGEGGWDYLLAQPEAQRLYVSHGTHVLVVDLKTNTVVASLDAAGVHGIALAPALNKGFYSNGGDDMVTMFDLDHLKILAKTKVGENPDAICYEPVTQRVLAFNGRSAMASVLDATNGKVLGEIALGGQPEFAVADGKGAVFVNLEDKSKILKLNPAKLSIDEQWAIGSGEEPSALCIDADNQRLFIGCRNEQLIVMDSSNGKVITALQIGSGVDAAFYDPRGQRVLVSCGEGVLNIFHQDSADLYSVEQSVKTPKGSRTLAFDAKTGTAYVPTAKFGTLPEPTPDHPKPRAPILPDTFEILVVH